MSEARDALGRFADTHRGLLLEDKGLSLALHYRLVPPLKSEVEAMMNVWTRKLGKRFVLLEGNMVYEIRPGGIDKGKAIAAFLEEGPFAGRVPVFIGDDTTDEDGFVTVNVVGGHSVKVGDGETAARWRLGDVACVLHWLDAYRCWRARFISV